MPERSELCLRRMEERDLPQVASIEREAFLDPWSENAVRESLGLSCTILNVAETEGRVAGYACAYLGADEAEITKVVVHAGLRRTGIGREILEDLISRCRDEGVLSFILEVRSQNAAAVSLYKSAGFECVGTRRNFYQKPADDALVMRLGRELC